MFALFGLMLLLTSPAHRPHAPAEPPAAVQATEGVNEPAMAMLGRMVGDTWRTTGSFVAEFRYEWRVKGKAIRAMGLLAKGTKDETPSEALYGWDPVVKKVYYLDFHGHDTIYKGHVGMKEGKFAGEFDGMVGDQGHYRFEDQLVDDDTLVATMFAQGKNGEWVKIHAFEFKRFR